MNLLKRISATFSASVDHAVRQIENHDALVEASINQARHHVAETQVRLARVQKENQTLASQISKLRDDEARWEQRAVALSAEDSSKSDALACLKRRRHCQQKIAHYTALAKKQKGLETEMAAQLGDMQARLDEVKLAHKQMRSRSANAEVQRIVSQLDADTGGELDDIFERWDVKLTEAEMKQGDTSEPLSAIDPLERQFLTEEEQASLEAELASLRQNGGKDHD